MPKLNHSAIKRTDTRNAKPSTPADKSHDPNVYFEKSVTVSIGDHEFAKVTVGIQTPVNPTKDDLANIETTIAKLDEVVAKEIEWQLENL